MFGQNVGGGTGAFGGGTAFGATASPGFGAAVQSPFGAAPQTGFGAQSASPFGGAAANTGAAFGSGLAQPTAAPAFGAQQQTSLFGNAGGGAFGTTTSQPAFGASAFGTPQNQGSTFGAAASTFGSPAGGTAFGGQQQGGLFGQQPQQAQGNVFGAASTPSLFGAAQQPATGFGGGLMGAAQAAQPTAVGSGSTVPFCPLVERPPASSASTNRPPTQVEIWNISAMPEYANRSLEEIRLEDYRAGRRGVSGGQPLGPITPQSVDDLKRRQTGGAGAVGTGGGMGFGGTTTGFGQQAGFGGGTSMFGQGVQSQPSTFGAANSTFGASSQSLFGASPAAGSPFSPQPQQQQQQQGSFLGAPSSSMGSSSPFGGGGSLFGNSQPAFGTSAPSPSPFGGASSASLFGGQSAGGAFGQPAQSTASLFGGQQQGGMFGGAPSPQSGGLFGASAPATGLFGHSAPQPAGTMSFGNTGGGGLFGAKPASSGGLFGAPATGGLFGNTMSSSSMFGASSSSLFGGGASSSSLFGTPNSGGLFGNTPNTGGGLFGGQQATNTGGGLFGATSSPGLFGAAPAAASGGLFGNTNTTGGGLFGAPANAAPAAPAAAQQMVPVSPGQSPYGVLPSTPKMREMKVSGIAASPVNGKTASGSLRVAHAPSRPYPGKALRYGGLTPTLDAPASRPVPPSPASSASRWSSDHKVSIFKPSYRESGLFIQRPFPGTCAAQGDASTVPTSSGDEPAPIPMTPISLNTPDASRARRSADRSAEIVPADDREASEPAGAGAAHKGTNGSLARTASPQAARLGSLFTMPDGYYCRPSPEDLALKAASNPDSLKAIDPGFTIGCDGFGKIMFLESVDVSDITDIGAIVQFSPGSVDVYPDASSKHSVGSGINQPARVMLDLGPSEIEPMVPPPADSSKALTAEQQLSRIRKRLQKLSTQNNSVFISYVPTGATSGTWTFEVPHFSRYGLPTTWSSDDDEDEEDSEEDMDDEGVVGERQGMPRPSTRSNSAVLTPKLGMPPPSDAPAMDGLSEVAESEQSDWDEPNMAWADVGPLPSGPLIAAAPHSGSVPLRSPRTAAAASPGVAMTAAALMSADLTELAARMPPARPAPESASGWETGAPVFRAEIARGLAVRDEAESSDMVLGLRPIEQGPSALLTVAAEGLLPAVTDTLLPDCCGLMGRVRRVGFGPQGQIAIARHTCDEKGRLRCSIALSRLRPGMQLLRHDEEQPPDAATVTSMQRVLQGFAQRSLAAHAKFSVLKDGQGPVETPAGDSAAAVECPRRTFVCTPDSLPCQVLKEAALHTHPPSHPDGSNVGDAMDCASKALAASLDLLACLYEAIEAVDVQAGADEGDLDRDDLVAAQRKRRIALWFQQQVQPEVHQALRELSSSLPSVGDVQQAIFELLTAHDRTGAASLACAHGHPRLATLLASAGSCPDATACLEAQVGRQSDKRGTSWAGSGFFAPDRALLPPPLQATYRLLAGDVLHAEAYLSANSAPTWQRALALCLWYGVSPAAGLNEALDAFEVLVSNRSDLGFPLPMPAHASDDCDDEDVQMRDDGAAAADGAAPIAWQQRIDVQYVLMHAAVYGAVPARYAGSSCLTQLLGRTRGCTADNLDTLTPWLLCCVLRGLGELPDDWENEGAFVKLTLDCVAYLEMLEEPLWAVYVALHLPNTCSNDQVLSCVAEILMRNWPLIEHKFEDAEIAAMLVESNNVPARLLQQARAVDDAKAARVSFLAYVGAEQAPTAGRKLARDIAPALVKEERWADLVTVVRECSSTQAGTPQAIHHIKHFCEVLGVVRSSAKSEAECVSTLHDRASAEDLLHALACRYSGTKAVLRSARSHARVAERVADQAICLLFMEKVSSWLGGAPAGRDKFVPSEEVIGMAPPDIAFRHSIVQSHLR